MILFNDVPIIVKKFPNGETIIEKKEIQMGFKDDKNRITLFYESDADLFQLLFLKKAVWFPVELHIPYFPYSRMDRKNDDYSFTLTALSKYLNLLEFSKVFVYEPHSDVTPALLNHCTTVSVMEKLLSKTDFNPELDYVLYPDAGAQKKYSDVIKAPHELIGFKKRDFTTGKITELKVLEPSGVRALNARVFIIDDLCSKGGTFVMAADKLREMGFSEINLVVAHCEKTIMDGKIFSNWDKIQNVYTTNSIPGLVPNYRFHVFDIFTLTKGE